MLLLSILATLYRVMVGVSNFSGLLGSAFPWRFCPKNATFHGYAPCISQKLNHHKMIPWKTTQKQDLVPQNSGYPILRTFSSPLDIMG